jgi:hypothetical protein
MTDGSDDVTAPRRHLCAKVGLRGSTRGAVMSKIITVGLDLEGCVPGAWSRRRRASRSAQKDTASARAGVFQAAALLRRGDGSLWRRAFLGPRDRPGVRVGSSARKPGPLDRAGSVGFIDASAAPDGLSFSRAAVPHEQRGAGAAGHCPAALVKPEGCAWTKERALPGQSQCYPHLSTAA